MRKLNRPPLTQLPAEVQATLAYAKENRLGWDDIDKSGVRTCLRTMQSNFCAYCGGKLNPADDHTRIDHFVPQSSDSDRIFDWTNHYLSCDRPTTCDSHKKKRSEDLVNPDTDDPSGFFGYSSAGSIFVREGLSPADAQKAKDTIDVLHLDLPELAGNRIIAFNRLKKSLGEALLFSYLSTRVVEYDSFCRAMISQLRARIDLYCDHP